MRRALEELDYFTTHVQILGVYPRSGFRAARAAVRLEAETA